jgi:hypothetical protein
LKEEIIEKERNKKLLEEKEMKDKERIENERK